MEGTSALFSALHFQAPSVRQHHYLYTKRYPAYLGLKICPGENKTLMWNLKGSRSNKKHQRSTDPKSGSQSLPFPPCWETSTKSAGNDWQENSPFSLSTRICLNQTPSFRKIIPVPCTVSSLFNQIILQVKLSHGDDWLHWFLEERIVAWSISLVLKNSPANAGGIRDTSLVPGLGGSPDGGHGNPLQYSCLENPMAEKPGRIQSMGLQRVRHDWSDLTCMHASYFRFTGMILYWLKQRDSC